MQLFLLLFQLFVILVAIKKKNRELIVSTPGTDPYLDYYQRELAYLRNAGARFGKMYPKVARRLELGPTESADPHVERLMEAFAYLTAKLQKDIDDHFPRISSALLSVLYPQFTHPLPSMTMMHFQVDPGTGNLSSGVKIPRGLSLFTESNDDQICRFRTCYPVDLWPLKFTQAEILRTELTSLSGDYFQTTRLLKLRVETLTDALNTMDIETLRVYLQGEPRVQYILHELLFSQEAKIMVIPGTEEGEGTPCPLPPSSLREVGFHEDESLFPYPDNAHPAYRHLFEYFRFPHKFLFFDLKNLTRVLGSAETYFDFYISIPNHITMTNNDVDPSHFLLGCTPAANLFEKRTEPFFVDQKSVEYRLVSDLRRERTTEIHSIKRVFGIKDHASHPQEYFPYFSFDHQMMDTDHQAYWYARRTPTHREDLPGSEMHLTFVDFEFNPLHPSLETAYAEVLCTNRDLPHHIPPGAVFQTEEPVPASKVVCLDKPTSQINPPTEGETQWRLISQLSLNHLSLSSENHGLKALKEIIRLYSSVEQLGRAQDIDGIQTMTTAPIIRRMGREAWRGFLEGTKITLTFDESLYSGGSAFLFATVINHFFGLYASVNAFTQLEIKNSRREGVWKLWPPVNGNQPLL